jgi:LPS-assembly lipoprotein
MTGFRILVLAAAALVAGCGFHLQGRAEYAPSLERIYVQVDDSNSDLARQLTRSIEAARIELTRAPGDATAVVQVVGENYGSRVKSVSAQNRPTELEVFYTAEFVVRAGETVLIPKERITRTRVFTYDERQVLAKQQEEALLRDALAREISGVITRRLANVTP